MRNRNSFIYGLLLGLIIPLIGFFIVKFIFMALTHFGLMQGATESIYERRFRTITLLAICLNLIPVNRFKGRKSEATLRGLSIATFIYVIIWLVYFYSSIF